MHIDATLEGAGKRYKDELRDVTSQLRENVSVRQLLLFAGHTPRQANGSPAYSYPTLREMWIARTGFTECGILESLPGKTCPTVGSGVPAAFFRAVF